MSSVNTYSEASAKDAVSLVEHELIELAMDEQKAYEESVLRELDIISKLDTTCQDCIQASLQLCGELCTVTDWWI